MCRNILRKVAAGMALAFALMAGTQAEALTFTLDQEFSGATAPVGTPPWLSATFTQSGANTVRLTMSDVNLTDNEFVTSWFFNLNPAKDPTQLSFAYVSGIVADAIDTDEDDLQADGDGLFDIRFEFPTAPPAGRFGAGGTSVYDLILTGLLESDFNFVSQVGGGNGVFHTAAHVQGIGIADESGWIGDTNGDGDGGGDGGPAPIPEPSTFLLLGAGLGGLAMWRKRRIN